MMLEEMMRAMQEKEKRDDEGRKGLREIMWPNQEAISCSQASVDFTFNSIFVYVLDITDGTGEKQKAAVEALAAARIAVKAALSERMTNHKFPGPDFFQQMVGLKDRSDD